MRKLTSKNSSKQNRNIETYIYIENIFLLGFNFSGDQDLHIRTVRCF